MTPTKPKTAAMHRSTKFLLASLSAAATLCGWAWLTLTAPPAELEAAEPEPIETAASLPTSIAVRFPTLAVVAEPMAPIPNLAKLPVRGLRYVDDPRPTLIPPPEVPQVQAPPQPEGKQKQEKADPAPPPPEQKEKPAPPPKRKTKSSK